MVQKKGFKNPPFFLSPRLKGKKELLRIYKNFENWQKTEEEEGNRSENINPENWQKHGFMKGRFKVGVLPF